MAYPGYSSDQESGSHWDRRRCIADRTGARRTAVVLVQRCLRWPSAPFEGFDRLGCSRRRRAGWGRYRPKREASRVAARVRNFFLFFEWRAAYLADMTIGIMKLDSELELVPDLNASSVGVLQTLRKSLG